MKRVASFLLLIPLLWAFDGPAGVLGPELEPELQLRLSRPALRVFAGARIDPETVSLRGEGVQLVLASPERGAPCGPFAVLRAEGLGEAQLEAICETLDDLDDPFRRPSPSAQQVSAGAWTYGRATFHARAAAGTIAAIALLLLVLSLVAIFR